MSQPVSFGVPERFQITLDWLDDRSPLTSRPLGYGFSLGSLRLVVRGFPITAHTFGDEQHEAVRWYLLPVAQWIAENWAHLFHEEDFLWPERTFAAAATACNVALERWLPEDNSNRAAVYDQVRRWWERHALRAGAAGGLFPDLFLRRLGDGVELSWSSREADFAPEGFSFALAAGAAVLRVQDVAEPLWDALQWIAANAVAPDDAAAVEIAALKERVALVQASTDSEIRRIYLGDPLAQKVEAVFEDLGRPELLVSKFDIAAPVADLLAAPVAMFGGVDPRLTLKDVRTLSGILVNQLRTYDTSALDAFVDRTVGFPLSPAHDEGYDLAEALLDDLEIDTSSWVDIESIVKRFGIKLISRQLDTRNIRGVALAGSGIVPTVIINKNSPFSQNEAGRRFTMAHELCHILYDQSRARRVAQVSGPWAPGGVEKRANAFAAMLLMPRALIERYRRRSQGWSGPHLAEIAEEMHVSVSALIEHLYNLGYIDEAQREALRTSH
ncbi:ImmA/IrrE family metallo-endopeptidase [Sphingomonas kyeonggiensis]|uniref:Zn-dependent peptidase ImmA (M78 family) n=1 Tax=Sphingomonas kyeonggiensis TaxID=1268553 RepID=A0A7W6NUV2_9SPHN|nr:ImmA/IrrE family metallo-endopeptidase [Sphingomonas kyeonggiensis]MBB4097444.1 Zn-dependent peptidase ImmA (M78 family) [Sphingomonas kyeonggiensis]